MNKKQFREFARDATPAQQSDEVGKLIADGRLVHPLELLKPPAGRRHGGQRQQGVLVHPLELLKPPAGRRHGGQRQQGVQQQQTTLGSNAFGWHAVASVTGGNPAVYLRQRGFAGAIAHTAVGINVLTLQDALDMNGGDGVLFGGLNGAFAVGGSLQFSPQANDTDIIATTATLTAVPAAAAADISFWIGVLAIGPN